MPPKPGGKPPRAPRLTGAALAAGSATPPPRGRSATPTGRRRVVSRSQTPAPGGSATAQREEDRKAGVRARSHRPDRSAQVAKRNEQSELTSREQKYAKAEGEGARGGNARTILNQLKRNLSGIKECSARGTGMGTYMRNFDIAWAEWEKLGSVDAQTHDDKTSDDIGVPRVRPANSGAQK